MKPEHILVTGSHSVGTTTTVQHLEDMVPSAKRIVTYDQARYYLERNNLNAANLKQDQKKEMQLITLGGYIGAMIQATHAKVMAIMDGSLIEVDAYNEGCLGELSQKYLHRALSEYKDHSIAYVIPPTIPLVNDGYRHIDKEYRIEIHKRIMETIQKYEIPYHIVTSQGIEDRAQEILFNHTAHGA